MAKKIINPTPELTKFLVQSGSEVREQSLAAVHQLAVAFTDVLRKGIMAGDVTGNIFERVNLAPGAEPRFYLDFLAPGTEKDWVAYTIPAHGRIPEFTFSSDYVMINTYEVGSSVDWTLRMARDARWDIVGRAMEVLMSTFVKKLNDDCWHVLLASGVDRNIVVYDSDASAGALTKRLVSLMKTVMRRNGGGNGASNNRSMLTDLYLSPEAIEDMRNWNIDQVDEITRREIYVASDDGATLSRVFGVNMHDMDEFGEGQEYQKFFLNELGGSLQGSDVELVVGLDLSKNDSFIMPVRQDVQVFEDDQLARQRRAGVWATGEYGIGALDNRRVILGSL